MNTQLAERQNTEVGSATTNYFQSYGDQVSQKSIVGSLLKFNKGDYLCGENEDQVDEGTRLVANMDELMVGWIRWMDKRPTDQIMGRVSEGYQPPKRNELGDDDKGAWEVDKDGRPQDPWSFSNYLILKGEEDDELYTFTTASRGGLNAIGELCKSYGKLMRQKPDEYPIIELGVSSYNHKEYGRIKNPTFKIVGWTDKAPFVALLEGQETETEEDQPAPEPSAPAAKKAAKGAGAARF